MATPAQTPNDIKLAMASTNKIFNVEVIENRNFDALDKIYTRDARILPPGAPMISGLTEIKQFWANMVESLSPKSAVLTSVEVIPAGDGVVEIGKIDLTLAPQGQPEVKLEGKYVVTWQQEDGLWKWAIDIWNMNA